MKRYLFAFVLCCMAAGAEAKDLARLSDGSATVVDETARCAAQARFRIDADRATFFEHRLEDLGAIFGAALNTAFSACPSMTRVTVRGYVNKVALMTAEAAAADGWRLVLNTPELDRVAVGLSRQIKALDDLPRLFDLFEPFKTVPGIVETSGYQLFAQVSRQVVTGLASDPARFQAFAQDLLRNTKPTQAEERMNAALAVVVLYDRQLAEGLARRFDAMARDFANAELEKAIAGVFEGAPALEVAVSRSERAIKAHELGPARLAELDRRLVRLIDDRLAAHETEHPGDYLDDLQAQRNLTTRLAGITVTDKLPQIAARIETARLRTEEIVSAGVADHLEAARTAISDTGAGPLEVDLVVETGLSLSREFERTGFEAEAAQVLSMAVARAEGLIEGGLAAFRAGLAAGPMDFERIAELVEQEQIFGVLAEDFEGFGAYRAAITKAVAAGKEQSCQALASAIGYDGTIEIGGAPWDMVALSCALFDNGHLLESLRAPRFGQAEMIVIPAGGGEQRIALVEAGATALRPEEPEMLAALVIRPPSGAPDALGVTECDRLAGDPDDKGQLLDGVDLERVAEDFDFERALDACLAAVEHDPAASRQVFQLARVLEVLGEAALAGGYAASASEAGYPAAQHFMAMHHLTYREDEDAFFDAVDLFKAASAQGHAPAAAELKALIPEGVDLFRPIPEPTGAEMVRAFGAKQCEGVQGFAHVCVNRSGVARKSCFQTSGTEFSCEVVFQQRCNVSSFNDPVMNLFTGMISQSCPTRSDPMFLKFTKSNTGWRARKEF